MAALKWHILFIACSFFIVSCEPDDIDLPEEGETGTTGTTRTTDTRTYQQRLADTLYKLAQQVYYWNTLLPDSAVFKPLGYASSDADTDTTLAGLKKQLLAITKTNT